MSVLIAAVLSAWTNTAGHVVFAAPVRIVGANVEMERREEARGKRDEGRAVTNSYPMAAFMTTEQKRIRRALGEYELPRKAAEVRTVLAAQLARAEARAKAGRMTPEALAEKRRALAGAWAHELEKHGLNEKEIEYWKNRGMR